MTILWRGFLPLLYVLKDIKFGEDIFILLCKVLLWTLDSAAKH